MVSALGPVRYRRAYYCRGCGRGLCPFDARPGVTARHLTPAAERLTALAGGACESFARGARLLREMAAVRLGESTVERATEGVGGRIAALLGRGHTFGPAAAWDWHEGARGRGVAYLSIDATGTRQQGQGGKAAEGRMA